MRNIPEDPDMERARMPASMTVGATLQGLHRTYTLVPNMSSFGFSFNASGFSAIQSRRKQEVKTGVE